MSLLLPRPRMLSFNISLYVGMCVIYRSCVYGIYWVLNCFQLYKYMWYNVSHLQIESFAYISEAFILSSFYVESTVLLISVTRCFYVKIAAYLLLNYYMEPDICQQFECTQKRSQILNYLNIAWVKISNH